MRKISQKYKSTFCFTLLPLKINFYPYPNKQFSILFNFIPLLVPLAGLLYPEKSFALDNHQWRQLRNIHYTKPRAKNNSNRFSKSKEWAWSLASKPCLKTTFNTATFTFIQTVYGSFLGNRCHQFICCETKTVTKSHWNNRGCRNWTKKSEITMGGKNANYVGSHHIRSFASFCTFRIEI